MSEVCDLARVCRIATLSHFISKISKKLSMLKRAYSCLVEIISPSEPW